MNKKYSIPETEPQTASEPSAAYTAQPTTLHIDITVEDNSMMLSIQKILKMLKGVTSVRISSTDKVQTSTDVFADLDTSWGGDRDANDIADELHAMRCNTRTIEPW